MEKILKKYYEGTGTTEKELMDEFIKEAELIKRILLSQRVKNL